MHVVGEFQRQPTKKRHLSEKLIGGLYDISVFIKFVTFLILVATTTIAAKRTFDDGFWSPQSYQLSPVLRYKFESCAFHTTRTLYAFSNVSLTLTSRNNAELLTDYAGQLRTLIILAGVALFLGGVNRELFRHNRFFLRYRHVYLHKDVLTTVEVLLLALMFYMAIHLAGQQDLLRDYLHSCSVKRSTYLPFVSLTSIFVFIGAQVASFAIATVVLAFNTLGNGVKSARGNGTGALRSNDPTSIAQADLHEEPDDVNSETEIGSEAPRFHPNHGYANRAPSHNGEDALQRTMGVTDDLVPHPAVYQTDGEEMRFAEESVRGRAGAYNAEATLEGQEYSYRSPTRNRPGGVEVGQRSYLQQRPQPLHRLHSSRSSLHHPQTFRQPSAATPASTVFGRSTGGAPAGLSRGHLPPGSSNVGSVPPPPHQSFYLIQQPTGASRAAS